MRALPLLLLALPVITAAAQAPSFGVCKPVTRRSSEIGCWILIDQSVGRATEPEVYWHLDTYPDSTQAGRARGAHGVVIRALGQTWLMTIDIDRSRPSRSGRHVADIGPLEVTPGTEYSATFMEAISMPGPTSAIHRHSGPEAWYTVAGETCLETPDGKIIGRPGKPAIVPQGPPMLLTTTGAHRRRAITLILHDATQAPTTMETTWRPKGLCR
jgi:quercetin dioxygenase-like cupin family protein